MPLVLSGISASKRNGKTKGFLAMARSPILDSAIEHERNRRRVWLRAAIAATISPKTIENGAVCTFADGVLERYDRKFPQPIIIEAEANYDQ